MLIEVLKKMSKIANQEFKIKVGKEPSVDLEGMAASFTDRLLSLFKSKEGARPFWGPEFPFKDDPHWKDYLLFYEYYHPETGKGLGASHQTGWSALVANLISEGPTS